MINFSELAKVDVIGAGRRDLAVVGPEAKLDIASGRLIDVDVCDEGDGTPGMHGAAALPG